MTEEKRKLIRELIAASGIRDELEKNRSRNFEKNRDMIKQITAMNQSGMHPTGESIDFTKVQEFLAILNAEYDVDEVVEMVIPFYDKYFEEHHLGPLIGFFKSDVGKAYAKSMEQVQFEVKAMNISYLKILHDRVKAKYPDLEVPGGVIF